MTYAAPIPESYWTHRPAVQVHYTNNPILSGNARIVNEKAAKPSDMVSFDRAELLRKNQLLHGCRRDSNQIPCI